MTKENCILSRDSRSSEKLIHDIRVAMAKNYSDNLPEEARNGMLEKAEQDNELTANFRQPFDLLRVTPTPKNNVPPSNVQELLKNEEWLAWIRSFRTHCLNPNPETLIVFQHFMQDCTTY